MSERTQSFFPPVTQSDPLRGPILLRDGRPAFLRVATREDLPALQELLQRSSISSRYFRFFGGITPADGASRLIAQDSAAQAAEDAPPQFPGTGAVQGLTLVVTTGDGDDRILGVGSYSPVSPKEAEVAFLVEDAYQGKGIGTILLERLALAADIAGFRRLIAQVLPENQQMLSVFQDSGYDIDRELEEGVIQIALDIEPTERSVAMAEARDRIATQASLEPFFRPRSVAVIGASRKPGTIGHRVLQNLITTGFNGPVYPVNPKAHVVSSIPAYPSVKDIPGPVDLAIVAVPQPAVLSVVDDCAEKGVRALVVLTAGFAETGPEGRELQERLVRKVRGYGMRMVGPNCLGIMNLDPEVGLNATFGPVAPLAGRVGMLSQSGALGLAIIEYSRDLGLGLSSFVSVGNKADVSGNDLLQFWEDDPQTDVILLYLESFGNPRRFARLARRVGRKKPILAVKSGRTSAGKRAAGSHTAALAASDTGTDALFRQTGVIRADTLEEMFDIASLLVHQPLPKGRRVAILTNAGGPAILCADALEAEGLELPVLSDETQAKLREFLTPAASVTNPVDMVASASAEDYQRALTLLLDDPNVDSVVVIFIDTGAAAMEDVAQAIKQGRKDAATGREKPLLASFMSMRGVSELLTDEEESIPSYRFPESVARALARAVEYAEWRTQPTGVVPAFDDMDFEGAKAVCDKALKERGDGWLLPDEVDQVLKAAKISTIPTKLCTTEDEAVAAAEELGFPVVVKLASGTLVHKSEWKGVRLNLRSAEAVRQAFRDMRETLEAAGRVDEMLGVTVQPMAGDGAEVMIGMTEDPSFGPLVAFGLGGVMVELLGDVVFRITPLSDKDAWSMVKGIRGYRILDGYRNLPVRDQEALVEMLLRIGRLVDEVPQIAEMDLNPVKVYDNGKGAEALDVRIMVRR